jgi:S1-C subfamily serine protease
MIGQIDRSVPRPVKNYFSAPVVASILGFGLAAYTLPSCGVETAQRHTAPAVYEVQATGCGPVARIATGFDAQLGLVFTAAHTLRGASSIVVDSMPAQLMFLDHRTDIAVLELVKPLRETSRPGHRQSRFEPPVLGTATLLRVRNGQSTTAVDITRVAPINIDEPVDNTTYRRAGFVAELASGSIAVGDSGSPVLNRNGAVIGMVFATDKGTVRRFYSVTSAELASALSARDSAPVSSGPCDN